MDGAQSTRAAAQGSLTVQLPLMPSFRLDGRRALVTGGSKGIGLAAAAALQQAGDLALRHARVA